MHVHTRESPFVHSGAICTGALYYVHVQKTSSWNICKEEHGECNRTAKEKDCAVHTRKSTHSQDTGSEQEQLKTDCALIHVKTLQCKLTQLVLPLGSQCMDMSTSS